MRLQAPPLHNRKFQTLVSTANPAEGSSLVNSPKLGKLSGILHFLGKNLRNLMSFNSLVLSFGGILAGIRGNLPSMGKIPLTYSRELLASAPIGWLTLKALAIYVSSRKRLPFCRFWGDNFTGKSYRRKWRFGGLICADLLIKYTQNLTLTKDLLASSDIREHY